MFRIGLGTDLHELTENRPLIIGGVTIPFEKGEKAHSDGDALLHAIADALLGASCLGDIGSYFPPEQAKWKDADSKELLKYIWNDVKKHGWKIENIDCVIQLEKPKLLPYRDSIRKSIAAILECDISAIFVKAKTAEKLGFIGQGQAISTQAVALLSKE
jgi:2-C-methyl-D-erythritol 2,4-cyclodiphosphate synthase